MYSTSHSILQGTAAVSAGDGVCWRCSLGGLRSFSLSYLGSHRRAKGGTPLSAARLLLQVWALVISLELATFCINTAHSRNRLVCDSENLCVTPRGFCSRGKNGLFVKYQHAYAQNPLNVLQHFHSIWQTIYTALAGGLGSLQHPPAGRIHCDSSSADTNKGGGISDCSRKGQALSASRSLAEVAARSASLVWILQLNGGMTSVCKSLALNCILHRT